MRPALLWFLTVVAALVAIVAIAFLTATLTPARGSDIRSMRDISQSDWPAARPRIKRKPKARQRWLKMAAAPPPR